MILPFTDFRKALLSFFNQHDLADKKGDILVSFAYKIEEINFTSFDFVIAFIKLIVCSFRSFV